MQQLIIGRRNCHIVRQRYWAQTNVFGDQVNDFINKHESSSLKKGYVPLQHWEGGGGRGVTKPPLAPLATFLIAYNMFLAKKH